MAARHPLRILLAEDNAVNQKLALRLLQQMGYRADIAANGVEAIESLERQPYDVVLMDVQMPEMDGLEATRRITAQWPPATARDRRHDRQRDAGRPRECLAAGMDDYMTKPIRPMRCSRRLCAVALRSDLIDEAAHKGRPELHACSGPVRPASLTAGGAAVGALQTAAGLHLGCALESSRSRSCWCWNRGGMVWQVAAAQCCRAAISAARALAGRDALAGRGATSSGGRGRAAHRPARRLAPAEQRYLHRRPRWSAHITVLLGLAVLATSKDT